jgi:hypothetical protein
MHRRLQLSAMQIIAIEMLKLGLPPKEPMKLLLSAPQAYVEQPMTKSGSWSERGRYVSPLSPARLSASYSVNASLVPRPIEGDLQLQSRADVTRTWFAS